MKIIKILATIFGVILSLALLSETASAQRRHLDCECNVTCTYADGSSSSHELIKDKRQAGREFFNPVGSQDRNDCRSYCDGLMQSIDVQSIAEERNACGTASCAGTGRLVRETDRDSVVWWENLSGRTVDYDGPVCNAAGDAGCCVPATNDQVNNAFEPYFDGPGFDADGYAPYVGNAQLDNIYLQSLQLENAINSATTFLIVYFDLYEVPSNNVIETGVVVYHWNAGLWWTTTFFNSPLVNAQDYEVRTRLRFWREGSFFSPECDTAEAYFYRDGGPLLRTSNQNGFYTKDQKTGELQILDFNTFDKVKPLIQVQPLKGELPAELKAIISENTFKAEIGPNPKYEWGAWINSDRPGGNGDYQMLNSLQKERKVCERPSAIECRTVNTKTDWKSTGETMICDTQSGGFCINKEQKDGRCEDYEVRFSCPSQ